QASLGGVTPTGLDASNELTELIMEASLRIAMPAPYLSLRLHRDAPERYWQAAARYIVGGLGSPVVNDEVLVPAFLLHGRSLGDARDYICSCCYENTIPGREAFHPNGSYVNLPFLLERALNRGRSLRQDRALGPDTGSLDQFADFEAVMGAFRDQVRAACGALVDFVNRADAAHSARRRYPLMSLFIEDCIARGRDVCAGGARYHPTGTILAGLPNVVNSLAAIRHCVFEEQTVSGAELLLALRADFAGFENVRQRLLAAPKWGNDDAVVDQLATEVTDALRVQFAGVVNPRGRPWQAALYYFVANHGLGEVVGASADGRGAGQSLIRNLDPAWGTDREGPTALPHSLSRIDFTGFPNGSSLDLRFDPASFDTEEGLQAFADFLKGFVALGVMQMQVSMVDTETLLDARAHPEKWPHLMVKVAGFSARFVDLSAREQEEIIGRTAQRLAD
ncbi:MAG: pyruvate formate lyase family protein, partial [Gemmatimonadota bacterium]